MRLTGGMALVCGFDACSSWMVLRQGRSHKDYLMVFNTEMENSEGRDKVKRVGRVRCFSTLLERSIAIEEHMIYDYDLPQAYLPISCGPFTTRFSAIPFPSRLLSRHRGGREIPVEGTQPNSDRALWRRYREGKTLQWRPLKRNAQNQSCGGDTA